jgi:ABC-type nickel/cobalt efflux system permease component RcnA
MMRPRSWYLCPLFALIAFWTVTPTARAHPVLKEHHDRIITVRLEREGNADRVVVSIAYRLEVHPQTAEKDLEPFGDERDKTRSAHDDFTRIYAPILAQRLRAEIDGKRLAWTVGKHRYRVHDENGLPLGHLRCDFEYRASAPVEPGKRSQFTFREGNYLLQSGRIDVSFHSGDGVRILESVAPSPELKAKAQTALAPGDDDRLREVQAAFELKPPEGVAPAAPPPERGLTWYALVFALVGTFWIGAVHALTPGHGKTLAAAYLIGERGTVWHALVLGLVTTFTHTAAVIVLAVGFFFFPEINREAVQTGLQVAMGLLVTCLGLWLLLRRLSGRADHIHIGGQGHHHHHGQHHHHHGHDHHAHHGEADHDHDAEGKVIPRNRPVGWRGLVATGMSGGIVPCWDAIAILFLALGSNMIWLALPLVLAFSAGLASVLVVLGILVVRMHGFAGSRWGEGRVVRSLPVLSALVVTLLGVWLCFEAVQPRPPQPPPSVAARS